MPQPNEHPHLGELLEATIAEIGMSKAEFGRRMATSRQNVSLILKKRSLDTQQLWRASEVLGVDFFAILSAAYRGREPGCERRGAGGLLEIRMEIADEQVARFTADLIQNLGAKENEQ